MIYTNNEMLNNEMLNNEMLNNETTKKLKKNKKVKWNEPLITKIYYY
jgi:hypothetical protein